MQSPALPARTPAPQRGQTPAFAPSPSPALPILGLFAVAAAFVLCFWGFVLTYRGQWVDEQALIGAQTFLAADTTRAASMRWLNDLPLVVGALCAVGLAVCAWLRRDVVVPLMAAAAAGLAMVATQLLKHSFLTRPDLGISEAWGNSFPSGHTTAAAAATVALVLAAPSRARPVLAAVGAVLSALTGAATVIMGWHRPSDVVAAFLVAAFASLLMSLPIGAYQRWRHEPPPARPVAGWLSLACTVVGVLGLLLAAWLGAPILAAGQGEEPGRLIAAGLTLISASVLFIFSAAERISRRWLS